MSRLTDDRAPFCCPFCDSSDIYRLTGTDGLYQCYECGEKTHEQIEEHRDELEELAASDAASSSFVSLLVGGNDV